ncbi:MAG: GH32 C-terminal domain-containing protein [Duncaniella sp.]|nr:GH32 C-terminal domain-containing protein [Duncaniella sp.]
MTAPNTVGFDLCSDGNRKVRLTYDSASGTLLLDRTHSASADIPKFSRIAYSKVEPVGGALNLHIFVDRSVVEIFVNDGETVMTALTFPSDSGTGASVFAINPGASLNLTAYPLTSIHSK